jgi:2-C-methyl-D-erythritol 4-phosphate cytidylyltransferase
VDACHLIDQLYLVVPEDDFDFCRSRILSLLKLKSKITLVPGGAERQDSVYNGLQAIADREGLVVIHDGVRPFVQSKLISDCIMTAKTSDACILALPVSETVKHVTASGIIDKTLNRDSLWIAQTPQVFQYGIIRHAHDTARLNGYSGTDDALLVERLGYEVKVITGSRLNLKITTPEDVRIAEAILNAKMLSFGVSTSDFSETLKKHDDPGRDPKRGT